MTDKTKKISEFPLLGTPNGNTRILVSHTGNSGITNTYNMTLTSLSAGVLSLSVSAANATYAGTVKVGNNLTINASGHLSANLISYVNTSVLNTTLSDYSNNSILDSNYVNITELSSNLANYQTLSGMSGYVSSNSLSNTLTNYVTSSQLDTTLSEYNFTGYQTSAGLASNVSALIANGSVNLPNSVITTNGVYTLNGDYVFDNSVSFRDCAVYANSSSGTEDQVLTSNSTGGVYWSNTVDFVSNSISNGNIVLNIGNSTVNTVITSDSIIFRNDTNFPSNLTINSTSISADFVSIPNIISTYIYAEGNEAGTTGKSLGAKDQVLTSNSTGGVYWSTPSGGGGGGGTKPIFSASLVNNVPVGTSSWVHLAFSNVHFDTASCYNASTHRFTPNVEGYYQFYLYLFTTGTPFYIRPYIQKNGSDTWYGPPITSVTALVHMNGTTDYVEAGFSGIDYGNNEPAMVGPYSYFTGHLVS